MIGLIECGAKAGDVLPSIVSALHDGCELVRRRAARAVGDLGPASAPALPHLMMALQDGSAAVRIEVVGANGPDRGRGRPGPAGPGPAAGRRRRAVRCLTAATIKRIGRPAVDELLAALGDDNPVVRERSAAVLGRLGAVEDAVVEGLLLATGDPESDVRKAARTASRHSRKRWRLDSATGCRDAQRSATTSLLCTSRHPVTTDSTLRSA